jgi:peptidoglycan/LPS O-acetylase OafA/YrhL
VLDIRLGRWLDTVFFAANYSTAEPSWYVGHFWSLAVEEHFYFLWPAACLLLHSGQRRLVLVVLLALAVALWRVVDFKFHITQATAAQFWGRTDIQADGILWGVGVALLYADPVWRTRLCNLFVQPLSWPALCALLLVLEVLGMSPALDWKLSFALISVKAMLMPLLILGTVLHSARLPGRVLESPAFRWIGRLSYSLYLWQQLFLVWADDRAPGLGMLQSLPLNLTAAFACATLSLMLIETPLIAAGHRLAQVLRRPISHSHHTC